MGNGRMKRGGGAVKVKPALRLAGLAATSAAAVAGRLPREDMEKALQEIGKIGAVSAWAFERAPAVLETPQLVDLLKKETDMVKKEGCKPLAALEALARVAVRNQKVDNLRALVDAGAKLSGDGQRSLLMEAVQLGYEEIVNLLIEL